jgi:hypothetical protein
MTSYRGWAALGSLEQIVEREVLAREGWAWTRCRVRAETEIGNRRHTEPEWFGDSDGGRVRLFYEDPLTGRSGVVEAAVEADGFASYGGCGRERRRERQFRVTELVERTRA